MNCVPIGSSWARQTHRARPGIRSVAVRAWKSDQQDGRAKLRKLGWRSQRRARQHGGHPVKSEARHDEGNRRHWRDHARLRGDRNGAGRAQLDGRFPDLKHMVRLRGRVVGQEQQQVRRESMAVRRRRRTRCPSHSHGAVAVSQDQREASVLGDNEGRMGPVGHGHGQEDNHPDPRKRSQQGGQAARRCPAVSPPSPLMGIASHAISSANRVVRHKPIRSAALALPTGSPPGKRSRHAQCQTGAAASRVDGSRSGAPRNRTPSKWARFGLFSGYCRTSPASRRPDHRRRNTTSEFNRACRSFPVNPGRHASREIREF